MIDLFIIIGSIGALWNACLQTLWFYIDIKERNIF